jgi:hypothetical protein
VLDLLENQLRNPVANGDWKVLFRGVQKGDHDLASVACVNRAGRIQHCDSVLGR